MIAEDGRNSSPHQSPHQPAPFRPTTFAKPSFGFLGLAVAVEIHAALTALGFPPSFRHFGLSAPYRPGTDFLAFSFPCLAVAMFWSHQGMGDFMQDGVQNLLLAVAQDEMNGKLDSAVVIEAQAH